uniref:WRKY domain-containing protein n=1 Tax=Ananas comosus var. bracteatus TaxID=296719 RepID=A0A6V7QRX7_ANACO
MSEEDDGIAMISEWAPPDPEQRALMSEYVARPISSLVVEKGSDGPADGSENQNAVACSTEEDVFGHKSNNHGRLAERMAARAGFNVPKLNMSHIPLNNIVASSLEAQSPYLTIPPGLSPTTLLDSPVFLSNALGQPSPTTGRFSFLESGNADQMMVCIPNKIQDCSFEDETETFSFKPHLEPQSSYFLSAENKGSSTINHMQPLPSMAVSVQAENTVRAGQEGSPFNNTNQRKFNLQIDSSDQKDISSSNILKQSMPDSFLANDQSSPPDDHQDGEADPKGEQASAAIGAPAEDGYNWRKYGQKQVKHSEFPRSYYKCTHPSCPVKKKVERSHEGHITEIIYKGNHNHPKPPVNRRPGVPSSHPFTESQVDGAEKSLWANTEHGAPQDWVSDAVDANSSASVAAKLCDPAAAVQSQDGGARFESADAIDVSSTLSNEEEEDDRATHGSVSLACDGEGDETESKRRKLDACAVEMSAASRAVREPRVVVQTTSEVDILDDGYRWRKYGQKVVKGNPNPRSYYKCTHPGCSVRKHVERASHDLKSVITTYEGKHNHEVPAARNSSHPSSTSGASAMGASQSNSMQRRPDLTQDGLVRFTSVAPLGPLGLPPRDHLGPPSCFSFGMGQPRLTNLPMPNFAPIGLSPPMHAYIGHGHGIDPGLMLPKGEPQEEPVSNGGSSVYQQMINRLPLGPQM